MPLLSQIPGGFSEQISLFRILIDNRRFDDGTLRILESALFCKDVKSLVDIRSGLRDYLKHESLAVFHEIAEKPSEHKLLIIDFFLRAFAIVGDVESCAALRYEGLVFRELKFSNNHSLQVSCREWFTFAQHSLDNGFYPIARKACEKALLCYEKNGVPKSKTDDFFSNAQAVEKITKLKDAAVISAASHSVQAQAIGYLKKKTADEQSTKHYLVPNEVETSASSLFRSGIKKRNVRKLLELRGLQSAIDIPHPSC